jgi:hypothetical protein
MQPFGAIPDLYSEPVPVIFFPILFGMIWSDAYNQHQKAFIPLNFSYLSNNRSKKSMHSKKYF